MKGLLLKECPSIENTPRKCAIMRAFSLFATLNFLPSISLSHIFIMIQGCQKKLGTSQAGISFLNNCLHCFPKHIFDLTQPAPPWPHACPTAAPVSISTCAFSPLLSPQPFVSHFSFPHGCLVCRECLLTDVFPPLTNNYSCPPSGRPLGHHHGLC